MQITLPDYNGRDARYIEHPARYKIILPDYKKIASAIQKNEVFVEEREIKDAFSWIRKSRAKFSLKSGPCQKGDWVEISFKFQISDLKHSNQDIKDSFVLGDGYLIPDLEEKIIGMSEGREKEISLTFPDSYSGKDLAGKQITGSVKIISVQKMELPEIDDNFVRGLGKFENLNDLKKSIEKGLKAEKEMEECQRIRLEILEKIRDKLNVSLPPELIRNEQNLMLEEVKASIANFSPGVSFEDYLARIAKTEKEICDSFLPEAESRVKNFIILSEIADKENILARDEEIQEQVSRILKNFPSPKIAEKELDLEKLKAYAKITIRNEKTFQFLESFVK